MGIPRRWHPGGLTGYGAGTLEPVPVQPSPFASALRRLAAIGPYGDPAAIQYALAGALVQVLGAEQVHFAALSPGAELAPAVVFHADGRPPAPYRLTTGDAIRWVAANGRPTIVDAERAADGLGLELTTSFGLACAALLPFAVNGEARAVVVLGATAPRGWSDAEMEIAAALLDVAGVAAALAEVRANARLDPVTGVLNREALRIRIAEEVARATRSGADLACAAIGLDDLGSIAERHGRPVADALLRHVTGILAGQFRPTDQIARPGDAEFIVILPDAPSPHSDVVAERVARALRETTVSSADGDETLRVSVGLAQWRPGETGDALLARADGALRAAQSAGGDHLRNA